MGAAVARGIKVRLSKRTRIGFRRKTQYAFTVVDARNGKILAVGSETYNNLADAAKSATKVTGQLVSAQLGDHWL